MFKFLSSVVLRCRQVAAVSGVHLIPKQKKSSSSERTTAFSYGYSQESADSRRLWAEKYTNISLRNLEGWWGPNVKFNEKYLRGNIENSIGVIRLPVGVVGPIDIRGKYANGSFLVPAATLEGTLIVAACRGARVLSQAGGVVAHAYRQRMLRVPVFYCESVEEAELLSEWIQGSLPTLREVIATVSKTARLKSLDFYTDEKMLNVCFAYESGEAAGQNMTTVCTKACCTWIISNAPDVNIKQYFIENILSGDKQLSALNAIYGRGISVVARATIPNSLIETAFKVPTDVLVDLFQLWRENHHKAMTPSVQFANVANMVAATFAAFGQDLGSVGECSQAFLSIHKENDHVDVELKMPTLSIGTVGGGTGSPTQSQCLAMVGCNGGVNSNRKLAEIIASVCLGAELSLLASAANDTFAAAHDQLGRNRPE